MSYAIPEVESKVFPAFADALAADALAGKAFAVTGCTSGTGLVAAKLFAQKGAARVFLLNRPSARAEAALEAVKAAAAAGTEVSHVDYDAMDFASVGAAAKTILAATTEIDVLCNNAGVMALEDKATKDGYDVQMQTNHLSHFALTRDLYPALVAAAAARGEARIVNHSSLARLGGEMTAEVAKKYMGKNGGDLGGNGDDFGTGGRWVRYHYTKLANAVFTLALKDKLPANIKALAAAPGLAATNLQQTSDKDGVGGMQAFMDNTPCQSGEDGAVPLMTCCISDQVKSGELWEPADNGGWTGPAGRKEMEDVVVTADRAALWAASEAAVGPFTL